MKLEDSGSLIAAVALALLAGVILLGIVKFISKKMKGTIVSAGDESEPVTPSEESTSNNDLGDAYDGSDGRGMTGM